MLIEKYNEQHTYKTSLQLGATLVATKNRVSCSYNCIRRYTCRGKL